MVSLDFCDRATSYALKAQIYPRKEEGAPQERNYSTLIVCNLSTEIRDDNLTYDKIFHTV